MHIYANTILRQHQPEVLQDRDSNVHFNSWTLGWVSIGFRGASSICSLLHMRYVGGLHSGPVDRKKPTASIITKSVELADKQKPATLQKHSSTLAEALHHTPTTCTQKKANVCACWYDTTCFLYPQQGIVYSQSKTDLAFAIINL